MPYLHYIILGFSLTTLSPSDLRDAHFGPTTVNLLRKAGTKCKIHTTYYILGMIKKGTKVFIMQPQRIVFESACHPSQTAMTSLTQSG